MSVPHWASTNLSVGVISVDDFMKRVSLKFYQQMNELSHYIIWRLQASVVIVSAAATCWISATSLFKSTTISCQAAGFGFCQLLFVKKNLGRCLKPVTMWKLCRKKCCSNHFVLISYFLLLLLCAGRGNCVHRGGSMVDSLLVVGIGWLVGIGEREATTAVVRPLLGLPPGFQSLRPRDHHGPLRPPRPALSQSPPFAFVTAVHCSH